MAVILYNFFIFSYTLAIKIFAQWNKKARLWVDGRKKFPSFPEKSDTIWVHCASLGEFEQGRPVIEALRKNYPDFCIVLSFYSPSGFEIRKNYTGADHVIYLPVDTKKNAKLLIEKIKPSLVVWVKYEYWFHYLNLLKEKKIPVVLVSSVFRKNQPFFGIFGNFWITMLRCFTHIFVQDANSAQLLKSIGFENVSVSGDTRFDRVFEIAENNFSLKEIETFAGNSRVLVAGSTWAEDEDNIAPYSKTNKDIKFIIAPHEINSSTITRLKNKFGDCVLHSDLMVAPEVATRSRVLIIDNIGMLSKLYKYASVAYIGGGFNKSGIHNILEAAVYGKPVMFGPHYSKFREASELVQKGAAFSVKNIKDFENKMDSFLSNKTMLETSGKIARDYVLAELGATGIITDYIRKNVFLPADQIV